MHRHTVAAVFEFPADELELVKELARASNAGGFDRAHR
jgi:hypothetical protein